MKPIRPLETMEILKKISTDRHRTNLLKKYEQMTLVYLVQRVPARINSDMLTFIGFLGSVITLISFILATYVNDYYLLMGVLGFAINWFGDSLDGRLAYYRKKTRKWYGFSLDLTVDWITTILIGGGFIIYADENWRMLGFVFVVLYGWAMITTLLRYKVTDQYTIDSGLFGPTEVRIVLSAILVAEVFLNGSIVYCAIVACAVLLLVNIFDTLKLLQMANDRDIADKKNKRR